MDAAASRGGVDEDAGDGADAVGELGALVKGDLWRGAAGGTGLTSGLSGSGGVGGLLDGVGFTGEDDGEAFGGEEGAETAGEVEGDLLFGEVGGDLAAGIGAAVGGVEEE